MTHTQMFLIFMLSLLSSLCLHLFLFLSLVCHLLCLTSHSSAHTILFLLTSNTEATENKVQFLNLAYRVKVFQCHSNNSLQLLELKEKTTITKQYTLFTSFLCDILQLSNGCNTQCIDTAGHAPTQTYLRSSLVDNVFSGKDCEHGL